MISSRKKKNLQQKKYSHITQETSVKNNNIISVDICLELMVPCEFAIYDSFSDKLCYFEGLGKYSITIDSIIIKEGE